MKKNSIELIVGLFIIIGVICMGYISIKLGKVNLFSNDHYTITADFTSVSGLKKDTNVEIAGVTVGTIKDIRLKDYQAVVEMDIRKGIEIQDDAIASIRTKGLLGEQYIEILPGASDVVLADGDELFDTEPPFDLMLVIKNLAVDE